jgi:hypothetical protein
MKFSEDMNFFMLNPNLEKESEKYLTLTPWHGTEKQLKTIILSGFL